jgi:ribonuclease HI
MTGLKYYQKHYEGHPLIVKSDSEYVTNTLTDWGPSCKDLSGRLKISFEHVSAHTGLQFNERCDLLANYQNICTNTYINSIISETRSYTPTEKASVS